MAFIYKYITTFITPIANMALLKPLVSLTHPYIFVSHCVGCHLLLPVVEITQFFAKNSDLTLKRLKLVDLLESTFLDHEAYQTLQLVSPHHSQKTEKKNLSEFYLKR